MNICNESIGIPSEEIQPKLPTHHENLCMNLTEYFSGVLIFGYLFYGRHGYYQVGNIIHYIFLASI